MSDQGPQGKGWNPGDEPGWRRGVLAGVQVERDAVVAYLRSWGQRIGGAESPSGLADEIEAGLHLPARERSTPDP